MTSAITRRQRGGSLSAAQGAAIYGHFRRHLAQRYVVLEITPALMAAAVLLARSHGLRAYDAVQLAAALDIERDHRQAGLTPITLVSADQALNDAATAEGLAVEDPPHIPDETLFLNAGTAGSDRFTGSRGVRPI